MNSRLLCAAVAALAIGVVSASSADASFALKLTNGASTVTIYDNAAGDTIGSLGVINYSGAIGDYTLTVTSTYSKPYDGSAAIPVMSMTVSAKYSGTGNGDLTVEMTDTDFGPSSNPMGADLAINSAKSTTGAVTYDAYIDLGNGEFVKTTQIGSTLGGSGIFDAEGAGSVATNGAYSLTLVTTINSTAANQTSNFDASFTVPEPATMVVWSALGLVGFAVYRRRQA
ncbi:PEP-CTERM sorting domain-containing protein [Aeoliella mucimassa]|uniref:PEP-CTERM protein-sorting domain-containing protein n=1 Tax=Aeoliella mucimassa TaxID=2527972 RepID=A0A518ANJ4_9BACT|nr:PEP-CTERM sorting domain-containing protein [Aeoliella mucimassa]QDU56271.1 hypothetical protein Pan181_24800 [Aeoliella mucimassa]